MNSATTEQLVGAALWYAEQGWPVFPVHSLNEDGSCTCGNPHLGADATNIAKHPRTRDGFLSATTDTAQIEAWWEQWPTANVAIRLGEQSNLLVLDIDPRNGGDVTLGGFLSQYGELPDVPEVKTGGGGWHFYFSWPVGARGTSIPGGIDIKADGGYVLAPPSIHKSGLRYEWRRRPRRNEVMVPPPEWVVREQRAKAREPIKRETKVTEGERHAWLVRVAGGLRRYGLEGDEIYGVLSEQNVKWCEPPLPADEIASIAYSADWDPADIGLIEQRALSDIGNARRIIDHFGDVLRRDLTLERWYSFNGKVWTDVGGEDKLKNVAIASLENIKTEITQFNLNSDDDIQATYKWHRTSQSAGKIAAAITLAEADERIWLSHDNWDANKWAFNVANGTLDLRTGELLSHNANDLITKISPVEWNPDAKCPLFERHLEYFLEGNKNVIGYLQRLLGYCMTGDISEGVFPIFWGRYHNGKSTLVKVLFHVFGTYCQAAVEEFLMQKSGGFSGHTTDVADLSGARLVIASEIEQGQRLATAQMKRLTGDARLRARKMRSDNFEFPITFKMIYLTNFEPQVDAYDPAAWRRIKKVPFTKTIPEKDRDHQIDQKLEAEGAGVLAWLVRGCQEWFKNGLQEPPEIRAATEELREAFDRLAEFIDEIVLFQSGAQTSVTVLYRTYVAWAKARGEIPYSQKRFTQSLQNRDGFVYRVSNSQRYWEGIMIKGANIEV